MMALRPLASPRRLAGLLGGLVQVPARADVPITGLTAHSAQVRPGALFCALSGSRIHGLEHVFEAVARGAAAVVWEPAADLEPPVLPTRVPMIRVQGLGQGLGVIASRYHGHPSRELAVIGVTGTDGKTSVTQFVAQALDRAGARCGVLGTLGYGLYGALRPGTHTTPDPVRLQGALAELRDQGARVVAMEVSSHALHQGRSQGTEFQVAVLTNLSRDHLDYHGTVEAYAGAKRRLFETPGLRHAVLNLDDAFGRDLHQGLAAGVHALGYGLDPQMQAPIEALVASRLELRPGGLRLEVDTPWGRGGLSTALLGRFNAANLLAALGVLLALDMPLDEALAGLAHSQIVAGRMEPFGGGDRPLVVVDYAHTPAALEQVLTALRPHCAGRLWCVFGCGGERDTGKRPLMGHAAQRHADRVIVTDDNPRGEDPVAIVRHILAGMDAPVAVIHDRGEAIRQAIASVRAGDVLLVAGKGHEQHQAVAGRCVPFSDRQCVCEALDGVGP
jgi:UDP-N-acetylmuramoyl-L-alanyl-D-glutamate--2,6-diaminopimelate ligase